MIDTAAKFFAAIRTSGGNRISDEAGAIEVLEEQFKEHFAATKDANLSPSHAARTIFWSGALLGLRLALRQYQLRLANVAQEQAEKQNIKLGRPSDN